MIFCKQYLPTKFVKAALMQTKPCDVSIEDRLGQKFNCQLKWGIKPSDVRLIGNWKELCSVNCLKRGSKIIVTVSLDDSSKWYARIVSP